MEPYLSEGASIHGAVDRPSLTGKIEAGLQLYEMKGWEVKPGYKPSAVESFLGQSLGLRGAWHF